MTVTRNSDVFSIRAVLDLSLFEELGALVFLLQRRPTRWLLQTALGGAIPKLVLRVLARRQPAALANRWVSAMLSLAVVTNFLIAASRLPRGSFWIRPFPFTSEMNGVAGIWATELEGRAAVLSGVAFGPPIFIAAAIVNGERWPPRPGLVRAITMESMWPLLTSVIAAAWSRPLRSRTSLLRTEAERLAAMRAETARTEARDRTDEALKDWLVCIGQQELSWVRQRVVDELGRDASVLEILDRAAEMVSAGPLVTVEDEDQFARLLESDARIVGLALTRDFVLNERPLQPSEWRVVATAAMLALTNVRHHAQAKSVHLELLSDPSAIRLRMQDDGRGLDGSVERPPAHSLDVLFHFVESRGGRASVATAPGGGAVLNVVLPRSEQR